MAAEGNRTAHNAEGPALPIDERVAEALEADSLEAFQQSLGLAQTTLSAAEEHRILFGMARRLRHLTGEIVTLARDRDALVAEYAEAIGRRSRAIGFLEKTFEAVVLDRRRQGRGNFLDLPGGGRWSSQQVPAGWNLPTRKAEVEAVMNWIKDRDPDAYSEIVKQVPTLDTTALRQWLDGGEASDPVPPGIERRPAYISVSYELRPEE